MPKDANALLQEYQAAGMGAEAQATEIKARMALAKPLVLAIAEDIGKGKSGLMGADRDQAMKRLFQLVRSMDPEDAKMYKRRLAKATGLLLSEFNELTKVQASKNGKEDEGEPIFTPGGWIKHHLVELFYRPEEGRTYLAVRTPEGEVSELMPSWTLEGQKYLPVPPSELIRKNIIRLPSELGERLDEKDLLFKTRHQINRYFDFGSDEFFEEFSPNYIPFSYLYDGFMEVSYLRALGDYGTGKTRFLKAIGLLCYRPIYMSGGSSAASIYHLLDFYRGTLILNEGDFTQSDESSIIAKILNGGTERDESITRMRGSMENMTVEAYNVFGPKVIATRKDFNDYAIRSRCITMEMVPMVPHPRIPQSLPPEKEAQDRYLRNLWTTFRMHNAQENFQVDQSQADRKIEPRLNQITLSLLTTIKDDEARESIQEFLRKYDAQTRGDRYEMFTARVLEGIMLAWAWGPVSERVTDVWRVYVKDIAQATNMCIDEMNRRMGDDGEDEDDPSTTLRTGSSTSSGGQDGKKKPKMKSRGLTKTFEKYLNLKRTRASDGEPDYKGTMYIDMEAEIERVKALCERWGVEWRERGSLAPGVEVAEEDKWMKRTVVVQVTFTDSSMAFAEEREKWQQLKDEGMGDEG